MNRKLSLWVAVLAALFAITSLSAGNADAKKRRGKKAKVTSKANVKALRELMGAFKFGMTPDQVVDVVSKQLVERYAEQIAATSDVYEQDRLRRKQRKEIKELKSSMVEFKGAKTGWDVSIIDDQFARGTDESMMVYWETEGGRNQRRFFFFYEGKLYKMFIALDTSTLKDDQKNFGFFRTLMENRFGGGEVHDRGIRWKLKDIHVEALDKLAFYNAFCLVVTSPKQAALLAEVRKERAKDPKGRNAVMEAVTADENDPGPSLDQRSDVIDNILKK